MTDDLISRAEAMTELQMCAEYYKFAHEAHGFATVEWCENLIPGRKAMETLRNLPTVDVEPKWIPCSERLPAKTGHYLCSFKKPNRIDNIFVDLAYWTGGRWYGYLANEINAWMPLPEPYEVDE